MEHRLSEREGNDDESGRDIARRTGSARPRTGEPGEREPTRTCVGCGIRDRASELVRLVVAVDEVAFDLAGSAFGRGAHVHARLDCLERAPRGLSRAFRWTMSVNSAALGRLLVEACDRRFAGLLIAARRSRALTIGADATLEALRQGAPLCVLARDAGSLAGRTEIRQCIAAGRVVAWGTTASLGRLFGDQSVAICAIRHAGIASELKRMRAAADAGAAATGEGAECSRRPEAR